MPKTDEACYQRVVCRHTCRHTITWLVAQVLAMLLVAHIHEPVSGSCRG